MSSVSLIELVFTTLASFSVAVGALAKVIQWQKKKWLEDQDIVRRIDRLERYTGINNDRPFPNSLPRDGQS